MPSLCRLFALLLPFLLLSDARGEGLIQLSLEGEIKSPGGALVEVDLNFMAPVPGDLVQMEKRSIETHLHLARGTTAHDLAELLVARLDAAGAAVLHSAGGNSETQSTQLFIERVEGIDFRLGHGLSGSLTLCDTKPTSVLIGAPQTQKKEARLLVTASCFQEHTKVMSRRSFELDLAPGLTSAEISRKMFDLSMEADIGADRPTSTTWSPGPTEDGAQILGMSFELQGSWQDRSLEVWL